MSVDPIAPKVNYFQLFLIVALVSVLGYFTYLYLNLEYPYLFGNLRSNIVEKIVPLKPNSITPSPSPLPSPDDSVIAAPSPSPSPKPTRSPYPLIPDNGRKGTYNISQASQAGPTFKQVIFDPLNASKAAPLHITVTVDSTNPLNSLSGTLQMDHQTANLTFSQKSRINLTETWETTLTLDDTVLYNYILRLTATNELGTTHAGVAPRSDSK